MDGFETIHYFGDKTLPVLVLFQLSYIIKLKGGNDYEIFAHERTVGHSVRFRFTQINSFEFEIVIEKI